MTSSLCSEKVVPDYVGGESDGCVSKTWEGGTGMSNGTDTTQELLTQYKLALRRLGVYAMPLEPPTDHDIMDLASASQICRLFVCIVLTVDTVYRTCSL